VFKAAKIQTEVGKGKSGFAFRFTRGIANFADK
jgi:hypothetical protein